MSATLVIQSASAAQQQGWMGQCMATVQQWATSHGYDYRCSGDELFALVPDWYMSKIGTKLPVAADYARLILAQQALDDGCEQVIWFDADLLILDQALSLDFTGTCAFGQEVWVQERDGKLQARRNIHNAVAVFRRGCPVLPFLIHCVESLIRRVDAAHIAPQMVGPKLLQALQPLADFALLPQVSALSPLVVAELAAGRPGPAVDLLLQQSAVRPQAVNLCASLLAPAAAQAVIEFLQSEGPLTPPNSNHQKAGPAPP